jgi:outer membrane protein assembly factor BamB
MRGKHSFWAFVLVVVVMVLGAAFAGAVTTTAAQADDAVVPALAGSLPDGTVYVAGEDGAWHAVDAATFAASGYDVYAITWYDGALPGTVGAATPSVVKTTAGLEVTAPGALAGLLSDGTVYLGGADGLFHALDAATFAASGYSWDAITWYDTLPGTVAVPAEVLKATAGLETVTPVIGALAGLLSDGTVYLAGDDGQFHALDAATFAAAGYDVYAITWYDGALPGTVA